MISTFVLALAFQVSLDALYREHNCDEPMTQHDMNACAGIDFERADAELNAVWREAIAGAQAADREMASFDIVDRRDSYEQVLRGAQRAWISFRDASCIWEAYEARGGSMEPMLRDGCLARMTRERIGQLRGPAE